MHDPNALPWTRGRRIDGPLDFAAAVHQALRFAAQARLREVCFVDPDFETWPLDNEAVLQALAHWARLRLARLVIVANSFEHVPRQFARFTAWRGDWAHVVDAHVTDVEPSQVPCLLLAGEASLMLADHRRWRGHVLDTDKQVADWREVVDVLLQRSEPGFAANTLGL